MDTNTFYLSEGTMPDTALLRKARFKAALTLARTTLTAWARDHDVTEQHIHAVLRGDRESQRLTERIDQFIAQYRADRAA